MTAKREQKQIATLPAESKTRGLLKAHGFRLPEEFVKGERSQEFGTWSPQTKERFVEFVEKNPEHASNALGLYHISSAEFQEWKGGVTSKRALIKARKRNARNASH